MGSYAASSDVTARIPARPIGTTSAPSTTNIDSWITGAEAKINGKLAALGISTPIANATGIAILKEWVCDYAEGRARMALAAGAGDGTNDDGKDLVEGFHKWLDTLNDNPAAVLAELTGGSTSSSTRLMRGYVTDNDDGKTIAAGDFDPVFDRDEVF